MNIVVLAPIRSSLYSRLLTDQLDRQDGIRVSGVVVRSPWSFRRIRGELKRDGARLIQKAYKKLVVREETIRSGSGETLGQRAESAGLSGHDLYALAKHRGIPILTAKDHNDEQVVRFVTDQAIDLVVFTGGGLIRRPLLSASRIGVLNCHLGLLPEYRGMDVIEYPALERRLDDPGLGMTLHFMDHGVDTGPIVLRRRIPVQTGDTFATIRDRVGPLMLDLVVEGIRGLRDNLLQGTPQLKSSGRQYYVMHPRLYEAAERRFAEHVSRLKAGDD